MVGKHGSIEADRYGARVGAETVPHWGCLEYRKPQSPASIVTHFLSYGHTYTNKATPPKSAAPFGPCIPTHEFMRPYLLKPSHYSNHSLPWSRGDRKSVQTQGDRRHLENEPL